MGFMDGMMGGGDGSGYGAAVDTITLTDKKKQPNGQVGNATAARPSGTRVAGEQAQPYTTPQPRQTHYGAVRPNVSRMRAPVGQDEASFSPNYMDQGSLQPPGPSPEVDGDTGYSPEIGPEALGGEPKKKKNTALIVGGLALLGVAAAGIGYAVYKSYE